MNSTTQRVVGVITVLVGILLNPSLLQYDLVIIAVVVILYDASKPVQAAFKRWRKHKRRLAHRLKPA